MSKRGIVVFLLSTTVLIGTAGLAQAHSPESCIKQIRGYQKMCKLSPTALIFGLCRVKQTLKDCKDRKAHDKKFHQ